ncbi:MAG: hypothetical protein BHV77_08775 [Bacteroides sp. 43_108]|nr:MAG: hypothetical protein BHV77_08775 [Bacteroides sp. 43_108]
MKIGILTFHRAHNYGAVLQAYALKEFLKTIYSDVEVVDYKPSYFEIYNNGSNFKNLLSTSLVRFIKNLYFYPYIKKRNDAFNKFIKDDISPSSKCYTQKDTIKGYDVLVYGSDQIWNGNHTNGPDNIFWGYMTSVETKKIVYAASTSETFFNIEKAQYIKNALQNFDSISVRERSILTLLNKYTEKSIEYVVDPTFLLSKRNWIDKFNLKETKHDYILIYQVRETPLTLEIAKDYAKKNNLRIIILTKMVYQYFDSKYNQTASPKDFVSLIMNADLVLTTSFHGTIFSVIFRKNFYTINVNKEINERSFSLLSNIGLNNRLIYEKPYKYTDVDYNSDIISKIDKLITSSQNYIQKSLI